MELKHAYRRTIMLFKKHNCYKKTKGIKYNCNYSKGIVSLPEFSVKIDIAIDGKPWKQWGLLWKIFVFLFKRQIIAREIGQYRNAVLERIIDSSISNDDDICDLITIDMKWVAAGSKKMTQIKGITSRFIKDSQVQLIFFEVTGIGSDQTQRKHFVDNIVDKLNRVFDNKIADLQRTLVIKDQSAYTAFITDRQQYINEHMAKNFSTGNLVTVDQNTREMEGTKFETKD